MIKRIKSLISVKNLTASQFADLLGVQRSNISHILSGRNKPSLDFVLKITEQFPTISIEWLINGKGEMFKNEKKIDSNSVTQLEFPEYDTQKEDISKPVKVENRLDPEEKGIIDQKPEEIISSKVSDLKKEEPANAALPDTHIKDDTIEQIMILYKNGSFKIYTPQK